MFNKSEDELKKLGADITTGEIKQQPELWAEVVADFQENGQAYQDYVSSLLSKYDHLRVIFSGAGTSAFVGESIERYLNRVNKDRNISFEAIATTDIVATPEDFLDADQPTLLVSFARSGNSPESVATVEIAEKVVKDLHQVTITCSKEGKLAQAAKDSDDNLLILQPERSNDKGFAMTGSYTCMTLSSLLLFDPTALDQKAGWVDELIKLGKEVIENEPAIQSIVDNEFDRVIYLGSSDFIGLARESQLKILELTAGQIATQYETPLGFRHGPKSFVNDKTLVILFGRSDEYSRKYDVDIMNEVFHDGIAAKTLSISTEKLAHDAEQFVLETDQAIPDTYLTLPYVMIGQTISLLTALKVGNKPDTPSPTGTVNRVVQGVIIYDYNK